LDTKASRKHHRRTASNAKELLTRLNARAANARADNIGVSASFDVGRLSEAYKKPTSGGMGRGEPNPAAGLDGYSWAKKAISMRGQDPELEFAAALITLPGPERDHRDHVQKANRRREGRSTSRSEPDLCI
jgi:hypothetical protein